MYFLKRNLKLLYSSISYCSKVGSWKKKKSCCRLSQHSRPPLAAHKTVVQKTRTRTGHTVQCIYIYTHTHSYKHRKKLFQIQATVVDPFPFFLLGFHFFTTIFNTFLHCLLVIFSSKVCSSPNVCNTTTTTFIHPTTPSSKVSHPRSIFFCLGEEGRGGLSL